MILRLVAVALFICAITGHAADVNTLSTDETTAGWKLLFDKRSFPGWHLFKQPDEAPDGRKTEDGRACLSEEHHYQLKQPPGTPGWGCEWLWQPSTGRSIVTAEETQLGTVEQASDSLSDKKGGENKPEQSENNVKRRVTVWLRRA